MSDPQGLRPFDPYRTLQLHPAAPRDLVEKAYWLLASSVHSSPVSGSRVSASRIEELNAAYGMLADDAARRSYDEAHGVRALAARAARSRSPHLRLFSARRTSVDYDDYYHVLRIDSEADDRMIQLAHGFWMHQFQNARAERERVEEAYRALSNPQLRAQYDARRRDAPPPEIIKITKQVHEQTQNARHNGKQTSQMVPPRLAEGTQTTTSVETTPTSQAAPSASPDVRSAELPASVDVVDVPDAVPLAPAATAAVEAPPAPAPAAEPVTLRPEARATDDSPAPLPVRPAQALSPATKLPSGHQLADAQRNRLLQLREEAPALVDSAPAPLTPALEQQAAAATIAFIAGPRTGERVEFVGDVVTLGSGAGCEIVLTDDSTNIEPEHARLTRRGATYMFRDIAGHDIAISDGPLPLAVVMLENGDEIQIGVHRLRFATES